MIGEVLFGRYRVDALLSSGQGVDVFRGADLHAVANVHIKMWRRDDDPGPALLEGEAMAAVRHPSVVRLVDFGLHEGRQPCLMMESVTGDTLAKRLRGGRLSWLDAFEIGAQVLDGLAALHDEGLVHRDVSTHSIVLQPGAGVRVKLVGLQHVAFASTGEEPAVIGKPQVGVPEYKAPEQLSGTGVRPATDLFALGVVMWEAITGVQPFAATPADLSARIGWRPDFDAVAGATAPPASARAALERMVRPSLSHRESDARACARRLRAAMGADASRMESDWACAVG
jgi:serine/threonine-protein kinase